MNDPFRFVPRLASLLLAGALWGCVGDREEVRGATTDTPAGDGVTAGQGFFDKRSRPLGRSDAPRDTLVMRRQLGGADDFGEITGVTVVGDYLLVGDRFTSPHLTVIDRRTAAVRARFGRDGEGPGEFREPGGTSLVPGADPLVWIYDFYNRRFTQVDLDAADGPAVRQELGLNVGATLDHPVWMGDRIVANGLFPDFTLLLADAEGKPLTRINADPPFAKRIDNPIGSRQANRSFVAAAPGGDRLALAYQFASRIDLFGPDGRRYGTVAGPRSTEARFTTNERGEFRWEPDNEMAYWQAAATDRYVYALFCGCELRTGSESPSRLHVFRWDGEFVAEMELDRGLRALAVSSDDSTLYGAFAEPYPGVGEWELPTRLRDRPRGAAMVRPVR